MVALSQVKTFRLFLIGLVAVGLAGGIAVVNAPPAVAAENAAISMTVACFNTAEADPREDREEYLLNPINVGGCPVYISGRGLVPNSAVTFKFNAINYCDFQAGNSLVSSAFTTVADINLQVNGGGVINTSVKLPENILQFSVENDECYWPQSFGAGFWSVAIEAQLEPSLVGSDTCTPSYFGPYRVDGTSRSSLLSAARAGLETAFSSSGDIVTYVPEQNSRVQCTYLNGDTTFSHPKPENEGSLAGADGRFDTRVGPGYTEPAHQTHHHGHG